MKETTQQRVIREIVEQGLRLYDAEWGLMRVPKRVHHHTVDVPDGFYHETRDTAYLALALLERAAHGESETLTTTARSIIAALHAAQYVADPSSPVYGLWHYYAELPVPEWEYKDLNWADFIAVAMLQMAVRHHDRLGEPTMVQLRECIDRAATCVLRRNVRVEYTNISALATYVLVGAGELLGREDYLRAGRERAERMADLVATSGAVDEYFSPGYTGVALMGLLSVRNFTRDESAREAARRIELRLWSHLADGWHLGSRELAGPHSRAYSLRMGFSWVAALLYRATDGELDWPDEAAGEFIKVSCLVQDVNLPKDLRARFTRPDPVRDVSEPGEQHPSDAGPRRTRYTTHLTEPWCLGTVDLQDSRTDRQNVLAYWAPRGAMIIRTRKDDDEGAFGLYVCAAQGRGDALVGVFPCEFDDPSPMRPRDGADAEWIDAVLVLDNGGEPISLESPTDFASDGEPFVIVRCGTTDVAIRGVYREGLPAPTVTVSDDGTGLEVRWLWYSGERRRVRWSEFAGASLAVFISVREPGVGFEDWKAMVAGIATTVSLEAGRRRVRVSDALEIAVPDSVLPMRTLYASYLRP